MVRKKIENIQIFLRRSKRNDKTSKRRWNIWWTVCNIHYEWMHAQLQNKTITATTTILFCQELNIRWLLVQCLTVFVCVLKFDFQKQFSLSLSFFFFFFFFRHGYCIHGFTLCLRCCVFRSFCVSVCAHLRQCNFNSFVFASNTM